MANFDNQRPNTPTISNNPWTDSTSSSSPFGGLTAKFLILDSHDRCIQAFERYYYRCSKGYEANLHTIKRTTLGLYLRLYSTLKRSFDKENFIELTRLVYSSEISDLGKAFFVLSDFLDYKKITRVDTRVDYDRTNAEEENQYYGL